MIDIDDNNIDSNDEQLSISEIFQIIKEYYNYCVSKKVILIVACVLGFVIGLSWALIRKTKYTASYKFTIESSSAAGGLGGFSDLLGLGAQSSGVFSGDNLVELIKSQTLVENTLLYPIEYRGDSITMLEYLLVADSIRSKCEETAEDRQKKIDEVLKDGGSIDDIPVSVCDIEFPLGLSRDSFSRVQDSVIMLYARMLCKESIDVAKIDKKLSFVNFNTTYTDEVFAKSFADALMREVSSFYVSTKTERTETNMRNVQMKADSVRKELDKCLFMVAKNRDVNLNPAKAVIGVEQVKIQTDIEINRALYTELCKSIEMMRIDLSKEKPIVQIVDKPCYPLINDKKGKLSSGLIGSLIGIVLGVVGLCSVYWYRKTVSNSDNNKELTKS